MYKVILIEDDKIDQRNFSRFVEKEALGYDYTIASSIAEAKTILAAQTYDIILIDYFLGDGTAFDLFDYANETPIILVTGSGDEEIAVKAMKAGAYDYLIKDTYRNYLKILPLTVDKAIQQRRTQQAERALQEERVLLNQRLAERTEELSIVNAQLARASRMKDEFLASMSHELRTPLNAILGLSEALQEEVYGDLNERQLRSLKRIEESGRLLLDLITDILDLSKIEAGKLELELRPVSIEPLCQASLRLVSQQATQSKLKIVTSFDSTVAVIHADERRLKQILVNLLSNAVKFTPEGGRIGLEVTGDAENNVVHFAVWDTGIGISDEGMRQLFQPFVQLDSALSRQFSGTGLGLNLVSRMTELHGGSVSVESTVNQGSCFTVSFPWQGPAPRQPTPIRQEVAISAKKDIDASALSPMKNAQIDSAHSEASVSKASILLAEDNEVNIDTVTDYLSAHNYPFVVARNGAEAIECTLENIPDIILMDIQMPVMDGLEAIRRIRAEPQIASIPIIALTALAMPGDRERCLQVGATDYLSKPVSLRKLTEMIDALTANPTNRGP